MDDTNPTKEDVEYVDSIIAGRPVADRRLGRRSPRAQAARARPRKPHGNGARDFQLAPVLHRQADGRRRTFLRLGLLRAALRIRREPHQARARPTSATCHPEDTDEYRGAPDRPGKDSPFRNRTVEENLDLFARMKRGEFPDGARTLRAKIDMASPNIWMRDPVLYRIRHAEHHHTGGQWCIYPMYDFAHCLSDYIEGITH